MHLIFNQILYPSIKDCERDLRSDGDRNAEYGVIRKMQKRPANFQKALRNDNFKREFVKFSTLEFEEESLSDILHDKTLYMTEGSTCFCYKVFEGKILKSTETRMKSKEADTKVKKNIS